jgi:DNA ligase-1
MSKTSTLPTLYKRTSSGGTQTWVIEVEGNKFRVISGLKDGKKVTSAYTICEGKNVGRANETSPEEQAVSEAQAKWDKQAKTGYTQDIKKIDTCLTYVKPMLAKNFEDRLDKIDWKRGVLVQNKFNGNRATAQLENGKVVLKTRKGELWVSVPHLNADLTKFFAKYPEAVLDGELFATSLVSSLNELAKIVRREKNFTAEDTKRSEELVRFWIYDGYGFSDELDEEAKYEDRKAWIDENLPKFSKYYHYVDTTECHSFEEVNVVYKKHLAQGQEGAIIRVKGSSYEHTRSSSLLKWKPQMDAEGTIKSLHEGEGNWAGTAKTATIEWKGKIFDATFKGTFEQGAERLKHPEKWVGKVVTFLYNDLTGLGVPNFARIDPDNCWKNDR